MLPTVLTKNVIAPRRQARKERLVLSSPNLGGLCAFARVIVFPIPLIQNSGENFKYFWLDFGMGQTQDKDFSERISWFALRQNQKPVLRYTEACKSIIARQGNKT